MSQPVVCPVCCSTKIVRLAVGDQIHPSVNGETNPDVQIRLFCCGANHIFMTLDETTLDAERVSDILAAESRANILRRATCN